jgi:acyl-CoA synthetase (AMP-forming)/AMP-acid ligase II
MSEAANYLLCAMCFSAFAEGVAKDLRVLDLGVLVKKFLNLARRARHGEVVCAWIKLKPDEHCDADAVRRFCAEQIAHYKVPHHIRFVGEFPMTVTGKIQKFVMREQMIEELNLNIEQAST